MRISDWSFRRVLFRSIARARDGIRVAIIHFDDGAGDHAIADIAIITRHRDIAAGEIIFEGRVVALRFLHLEIGVARAARSEEHTSELQSLMRLSSAVFYLKK